MTHASQEKRIYALRPIAEEDLEWARLLHNDPDVISMLKDPNPVTPEMQKKWFASLSGSKKSKRIVVRCNTDRIGLVRLDEIDLDNRSVAVGLDIDRDHRGRGHAAPIYGMILDYCFNALDMHRCWLEVAAYNDIGRHIYKKLGFMEEGKSRERIYRFGAYHDYILMGMLKDEYLASAYVQDLKKSTSYSPKQDLL